MRIIVSVAFLCLFLNSALAESPVERGRYITTAGGLRRGGDRAVHGRHGIPFELRVGGIVLVERGVECLELGFDEFQVEEAGIDLKGDDHG